MPEVGSRRQRSSEPRPRCMADGCQEPTTNRKPYCIDHLDHLPYVQWLTGELDRRGVGAAASYDGAAEGIVEHLEVHGVATVGRLSREVQVPRKSLEECVTALERAGIVETERVSCRGGRTLRIVKLASVHETAAPARLAV